MKSTNYYVQGKQIDYQVTDEGYMIYLGGKPWISQKKAEYIPYERDTLEESCLAHIEYIVEGFKKMEETGNNESSN